LLSLFFHCSSLILSQFLPIFLLIAWRISVTRSDLLHSLSQIIYLFIYFHISQRQNCKASPKISPKRRLAWLPLRSSHSVSYIICIYVCMCVYVLLIECVCYIKWESEWASAGGRHLPLFQCSKGFTWYAIFPFFSFCCVPFFVHLCYTHMYRYRKFCKQYLIIDLFGCLKLLQGHTCKFCFSLDLSLEVKFRISSIFECSWLCHLCLLDLIISLYDE
jgi:hypothetical protein